MWELVIIVFCLSFNALLSATELAFVSLSKGRLKRLVADGRPGAEEILRLRENPEKALSVLQLGTTFVGVIAAAVGGAGSDQWLSPILNKTFSPAVSEVLAILLFVVPYTFISVVLSELLPKSLALRNPKWVLFHAKGWLIFMGKILAPVVFLLEKSTKWCVRIFFPWLKTDDGEKELAFTVGKVLRPYMVNLAKIEKQLVADVMVPWENTATLDKGASIEEVKAIVLETKHTRLPVVENGLPFGLLQTKEFMAFFEKKDSNWQGQLKPLIKLLENDNLVYALKLMQGNRCHMSIIYRGDHPIGIVTIEDILEEVVGEIYDEDDFPS